MEELTVLRTQMPELEALVMQGGLLVEDSKKPDSDLGVEERPGWIEKTIKAGLRIPLNFSNSNYSANLTISNSVGLSMVENFDFNQIDTVFFLNHDLQQDGSLLFNEFNISYTHFLKRSKRDIRPTDC